LGILAGYVAWMAALIIAHYTVPGGRVVTWALIGCSGVAAMVLGVMRYHPQKKLPWLVLALSNLCPVTGPGRSPSPTPAATPLSPTPTNTLALPVATKVTLTGEGTTLVPSAGYVTSYGYGLTGSLTSQQDPASGGQRLRRARHPGMDRNGRAAPPLRHPATAARSAAR
jgi:hypothetical protein